MSARPVTLRWAPLFALKLLIRPAWVSTHFYAWPRAATLVKPGPCTDQGGTCRDIVRRRWRRIGRGVAHSQRDPLLVRPPPSKRRPCQGVHLQHRSRRVCKLFSKVFFEWQPFSLVKKIPTFRKIPGTLLRTAIWVSSRHLQSWLFAGSRMWGQPSHTDPRAPRSRGTWSLPRIQVLNCLPEW